MLIDSLARGLLKHRNYVGLVMCVVVVAWLLLGREATDHVATRPQKIFILVATAPFLFVIGIVFLMRPHVLQEFAVQYYAAHPQLKWLNPILGSKGELVLMRLCGVLVLIMALGFVLILVRPELFVGSAW